MNSAELARRIFDCLSDGYDDEEMRDSFTDELLNELNQIEENSFILIALKKLCERVEELEG